MPANTAKYIEVIERNKCQAPEQSLRVGCLIEAAKTNCRPSPDKDRCTRISDVIMTNRLAQEHFVPKDLRYTIMNKFKDYRTEVARELHRRYAMLVSELVMSRHFPGSAAPSAALAAGLDGYCTGVSGTRALSWQ